MSGQKYTSFLLKSLVSFLLFAGGYTSVFALPGFIVDGSNGANSTGPCTGKTVCHISGDLTYSDITLINGGKLSHRQGTLTVSNNFLLGGTGAGFFVGQNTIVGNLLKIQGDSVFALNSNLTSDPASNNISDWMGATYYDLQVSNTNLSFTGMDVSLSTSCTTAGGGSTLSACIQTRNVNVNSKLSAVASATNVVWKTYANGYLAVDGDATLTNIKMDVAGYLFVQGNVFGSFNNAHYVYVTGGQQVSTPDAVGFTTAGVRVDGNMTLTGSASLPDFYMSGATGTAADNWYVSGSLFVKQMSLGTTSQTNSNSLGSFTVKNGTMTVTDADTFYFNGNIYVGSHLTLTNNTTIDGNNITCNNGNVAVTTGTTHTYRDIAVNNGTLTFSGITTLHRAGNITAKNDITLTSITTSSGAATNVTSTAGNVTVTTGTTHTYKDISVFGNLSFSGITTSLDTRIITNSGATTLTNILLHNRTGNITTVGNILFNNVTTSSGATTNVTSTTGNITVTTGTTHTYNYLNAYKDNSVTSITSYNANNISTNGGLIMTGSTLNITDMTDASDETKQNIDISTGSGFIITNSTANLQNSSIQTNGYLEVNNTDWKSQNLNINGYTTLSAEKVGIYFRGGKDRTIFGSIFAGGGSIWVGTAATPDDGNIFLKRKAGVTTNGNIKMYRSNTTIVDGFTTAPDVVPTPNTSLFTQLYNASLLSLSGSITVLTGSTTNKDYVIDGNTATSYESSTAGSAFRVDFPRDMIISKMCVVAGTNEPDNIKLQFMDASSTIINTQTQKMPTTGQPRTCFDLNSYKARKILVTGYGANTTLGFGELEFWGVPVDTANIAAPFGNDIVLQNGSYEFWGVLTSGNLNASSTTGKKIRAIQYHNNAPFNHKNSIALASASAWGTTFTHSVGNEAGLRFITDTMNVGANVTVDVVGKGYLGGNSNNEFYTSTGWVGNITPGALKIAAGDGGMGGGIGGYGVSGGGGGGGMLGVKNSGVWGNTTQKFFTGSKGGGYTYTQCIIDSPYGQEGRLRCSGLNNYGQVGNNSTSDPGSFTPVSTTSLSGGVNMGWSYVSNGYYSTCGIKDGSVYCWGYRGYSIMADGNPTATNQAVPMLIGTTGDLAANGGNRDFIKVLVWPSGANEPTCALKMNGDLYCWGENSYYQIDNTGVDILYPKLVGNGIKDFGVHYQRIAIIDSTGRIWQRWYNQYANITNNQWSTGTNYWGGNTVNQICPNGSEPGCGTPAGVSYDKWIKKIDGNSEAGGETWFEKVFLNYYTGCAIKSGVGYCWGYNNGSNYAVGWNSSESFTPYFRALRVQNGTTAYNNNIKEIWPASTPYLGWQDSWCLLRNGAPYCWGYNNGSYPLGNNNTSNIAYPQYWNGDVSGVNYPSSNYRNGNYSEIVPLSGSTCGIGNNGYLYCWWYNPGYYVFGGGNTSTYSYPYQHGGALATPIGSSFYDPSLLYPQFSANGGNKNGWYAYTNCVIDSGTKLWCSGYNSGYWNVGDSTTTDRQVRVEVSSTNLPNSKNEGWTQVSAGYMFTCWINAGKVYCWGYGWNGQIWNGSSSTVYIPTQISGWALSSYGGNADFGKVLVSPDSGAGTHACAMKTSGTYKGYLFCWGYWSQYQINTSGTNYNTPQLVPASPITGSNVWRDFGLGYRSTFAIDIQGNVLGRGINYSGMIFNTSSYNGNDTYYWYNSVWWGNPCFSNYWCVKNDSWHGTGEQGSYVKMDRIYVQYQTICGIKNGSVYCWWYSGNYNVGNTSRWTSDTYYPIPITNTQSVYSTNTFENNNVSDLVPNGMTTDNGWCALRLWKVYCWWYNWYYQNGRHDTSAYSEPYDITPSYLPSGINGNFSGLMYGGDYSVCWIQTSGAVYCWWHQSTSYSTWWDNFSGNQTSGYAYQGGLYLPSLRSNFTFTNVQTWFPGSGPGSGGGNLGYGGYGGSATCTGSLGNNSLGNTKGGNGGGALGGSGSNWHGGGGQVGACSGGGGGTGGNSDANPYRLGSGGGAGGLAQNDYTKGYGGNGGGMIRISTNTLILSWSLLATGNVGKDTLITANAPTIAAWAGGAGGSILIRAKSLTCATGNAIDVKGGNGWAGASNVVWGGGGGGWVITYYYTNKTGTCNGAVLAGAGGTNGGATGGQDGKVYESVGTTFDTLKSRVTIENSPAAADGVQAVTVRAYFLDVNGVPLEGEYLVAEVVGDLGTGKINGGSPLPQTDANGMLSFPVTSTVKGIKKIILKNALTYTELQEQPTLTFGIPQVSIAKVADKSTVNSGDVVTYTITLTNSGSGDAGGDPENAIVIEDVLPTGFTYWTTGPTAGSKWDTGSGTTQYYIFPEVTGDGTAGNEQRLRYTVTDGLSGPANIPSGGGKVRILFDVKAP